MGDNKVHKSDFRVIAATNQNLEEMVKKGKFREDLFYRLYVFPVNIPPLRERKEDIPLLVEHFLDKFSDETHNLLGAFELSLALEGYDWPGNVRELSNTVQRYVALGNIETLNKNKPPEVLSLEKKYSPAELKNSGLKSVVESYEKDVITKTLDANQWRRKKTANLLGITTRTLHRKMKQYQIKLSYRRHNCPLSL